MRGKAAFGARRSPPRSGGDLRVARRLLVLLCVGFAVCWFCYVLILLCVAIVVYCYCYVLVLLRIGIVAYWYCCVSVYLLIWMAAFFRFDAFSAETPEGHYSLLSHLSRWLQNRLCTMGLPRPGLHGREDSG